MGLSNDKSVKFLDVQDGKFIETFKNEQPFTKPQFNPKTGENTWVRQYDSLGAELVGFQIQEFGANKTKFLRLKMEESEGIYFVKMFLNSNYARSLMKVLLSLPRLENRVFVLKPYDFQSTSENSTVYRNTGISVYFNTSETRNKLNPLKNDQISDLPEPIETKEGRKDYEPQSQFLFDRMAEKFDKLLIKPKNDEESEDQPF